MEHIDHYLNASRFHEVGQNDKPFPVIRNMGHGNWYWIDKNILKVYATSLGPSAIAVYNVLALYSNAKTQTCYPSHKTIGKIAGMSKKTVSQKIRYLERAGLICRKWQRGQTLYYLLDVSQATITTTRVEKNPPDG
jgi:DNA-binding transcriptional ArsR family regulator